MKISHRLLSNRWIRASAVALLGAAFVVGPATAFASKGPASQPPGPSQQSNSVISFGINDSTPGPSDSQDTGGLTIVPSQSQPGKYKATWVDPSLHPGEPVFLVGVQGTQADSTVATIETLATGTAMTTSNGVEGVVYFTPTPGTMTAANPESFEMHNVFDLESLPVSQMPEVPWAAGLPLIGLAPLAYFVLRHRHHSA